MVRFPKSELLFLTTPFKSLGRRIGPVRWTVRRGNKAVVHRAGSGEIVGIKRYAIIEDQKIIEQRELPIHFHLINKAEIESLLANSGFKVVSVLGDYDDSKWSAASPFLIMERRRNAGLFGKAP